MTAVPSSCRHLRVDNACELFREGELVRPLVIGTATVIVLAGVAVALARLGGTVGQLRALEYAPAPIANAAGTSAAPNDATQLQLAPPTPSSNAIVAPSTNAAPDDAAGFTAASGDEHLTRALAQNPDFARAAAELLQYPDSAVQAEARELLRQLGAAPEADPER
jgi:hypothetical protein